MRYFSLVSPIKTFDVSYASLFDTITKSSQIKRAKSSAGAIRYLEANNPTTVLVTDEGLADEQNKLVLEKLVKYVRNGGRVIIGFHFSTFVQWTGAEKIFVGFGLPWKSGDYTRHDCYLSPECVLPPDTSKASFPTSYYMKAVFIRDARNHEKLLIPKPEDGVLPVTTKTQAAVAGAKVGMGYLFYIGDVNPGEEFDKVILALSGFS